MILDHKTIGYNNRLFHLEDDGLGVFWHADGEILYSIIRNYIRSICKSDGYEEIRTPSVLSKRLWEKSGHWDKFSEYMFKTDDDFLLKPMSCPCHVKIFNKYIRNYKELPIKFMEFGHCHRNEASGAVMGLMRNKSFTQDDGHIFCTEEDISFETKKFCDMAIKVYEKFGLKISKILFSDRPEKRIGSDDIWSIAENALKKGLGNIQYELNKGEGAFYGPKIELILVDAMQREWQCGTLQIDFFMPERLNATYIDKNNTMQYPIMIHRAILGSFERFIAILLEHYQGRLPFWLSPLQIGLIPLTNNVYIDNFLALLHEKKIRYKIIDTNDHINNKIKQLSHATYTIIIGEKEVKNNTLSIRSDNKIYELQYEEFINRSINEY